MDAHQHIAVVKDARNRERNRTVAEKSARRLALEFVEYRLRTRRYSNPLIEFVNRPCTIMC